MGLLGDYLTRNSRREAEEKSNQLEAYKYVLTAKDDEVKPEAKQYALDQMMKTAGMKGPGKELFTGLLGGLIKRKKDGAAKQEAPPSFEGPGVPGGQTGFSRQQATGADGLPETRVKPEMSAGEAPSTGMFYSTGEQQEMLRQRQEQADQHALDVKRQGIELTDKLTDAHSEAIYQQSIQTIDRMKDILPPERIHDMISAAIDARFNMKTQRTPATPAAEMKEHTIRREDGSEVAAVQTGPQQYAVRDSQGNLKPVPFDPFKDKLDPKTDSKLATDEARAFAAYREKHNVPPGTKLTDTQKQQAISEQKEAEADPEVKASRALTRELAQGRLDEQRKAKTEVPMNIQPGMREYKVAESLAYGRLTFAQLRSLTAYGRDVNKKLDIYDKAMELNPAFNAADFERGYKFSSNPKVMQQLSSLNNVKMGVDDLLKASDAASRTGAPLLNKAVMPGGITLGGKKYSNFNTARIAFADELSGALGYGSATDMSREMGFNMTDATLSPEQFRSAIQDIVMPFVDRKKKSITDQMSVYGDTMNRTGDPGSVGGGRGGGQQGVDMKGKSNQELLDILSGKSK